MESAEQLSTKSSSTAPKAPAVMAKSYSIREVLEAYKADDDERNGKLEPIQGNWIEEYVSLFSSIQESPADFHLWTALTVLAAATERKVWLNRGFYDLFPNLYVMLVGSSARVRKTSSMDIAEPIFKKACPDHRVISQKISPSALIGCINETFAKRKVGAGVIISEEFADFLKSAEGMVELLTKLYTPRDMYDYTTRDRGTERCERTYLNLLAASTPEWLQEAIPRGSIGGGFASRFVFVYRDKMERIAWPSINKGEAKKILSLTHHLTKMSRLEGQVPITLEAMKYFEDWYTTVNEGVNDEATDGYYGRRHDTALKVATLLAIAADYQNTLVETYHIQAAMSALGDNEKHLPQIMRLAQRTEGGRLYDKVLRSIQKAKKLTRTKVLTNFSYCANAAELDPILRQLEDTRQIESYKDNRTLYYKYIGKGLV